MARGEDEGKDFHPATPKPGTWEHRERWKGRDRGARKGRDLKRRMDKAKAKTAKGSKGKGCVVTALSLGVAAAGAYATWRGLT